ncbi:hypothetical protein HYN48_10945 [Flavobacterium magnum]|uniref:VWA domain-containing protein n=1 Tax=Flavobacterium magnum TaxID=2162713 RepID=A0A2S0RFX2_9FLAO|nr:hypothetical protein [Flavobacterium magnum]AWA30564.1 hypothetical protein HYN48_10945 [Flavobacterium magnum]
MALNTILLIILALALAAGLSFYQYLYKSKTRSRTHLVLSVLRFLSVFGILLLLINPKITRSTFETEKTPLPIVVDNSESVKDLKADATANELFKKLYSDSGLREKFDVQGYRFDTGFELSEKFDFKGTQTNIDEAARNLKSINRNKLYPTILISDGNQTTGNDYVFSFDAGNKVYPLILGDTTTFTDLRISQLNVNKYAFLKNKFPVEVFLQYSGTKAIEADFSIAQGSNVLAKEKVSFSPSKRSAVVNVLLPAEKNGLQIYRARLSSAEAEKNSYNNIKNFAVEVIDQKSEIAIVASFNHPDLGALKRSIEMNPQRHVTIVKPTDLKSLDDYNVLVLYQPTADFKPVFDSNRNAGINTLIITGTATDFNFLNQQQQTLNFKMSGQKEDYSADFNTQFNLFAIDDFGFDRLPPLQHAFGTITASGNLNVLLSARIRNIATGAPLLAFTENAGRRTAFLLGENIWKWRLQSHADLNTFEKFDLFSDKIIQYLASNNARKSLVVNHERFYNSGDAIEITAQYFNKNYEFDEKARLTIAVTNRQTKQTRQYDMLKGANAYKANLDGLAAGQYTFSVVEQTSKNRYNGSFEILDFNIEKQFVNPDVAKLNQLAAQTGGKTYVPNQADALIKALLENPDYKSIQKEVVRKIPLVDSMLLLIAIAALLSAEWFIRKYNGML